MQTIGDNTNAPMEVLAKQVLICAGEDPDELVQSLRADLGCHLTELHRYRCYRFWKCAPKWNMQHELTLVWTGIGTGCIEPLLHEMLHGKTLVSDVILIGTAGQIDGLRGQGDSDHAFVIVEAHMGPTALSALGEYACLRPTLKVDAPSATIFSTDLYYLWSTRAFAEWPNTVRFHEAWAKSTLVDMETAQFYWLCRRLGKDRVRYAAIKGAANQLGVHGQQIKNSRPVLRACASTALQALGITGQSW
jgi:hypothetical protein